MQVGHGGISEHDVAGTAGEGVAYQVTGTRVAGTQQLVVVVLGIAVHLVVRPDVHVGAVHTGDKHAVAGQMGVPARLLAVLDDEELVLHGAAQDVSLAAGVHGIKRIRARLGEFTALGPSQ